MAVSRLFASAADVERASARNRAARTPADKQIIDKMTREQGLMDGTIKPGARVAKLAKETRHGDPGSIPVCIQLPFPPSVNHYWLLNRNGSRRISDEGLVFRANVHQRAKGLKLITGQIAVHITANPPDRRRRDLDNLLKSILDSLMHAGLIEDDSNVVDLHIVKGHLDKGGSLRVSIAPVKVCQE